MRPVLAVVLLASLRGARAPLPAAAAGAALTPGATAAVAAGVAAGVAMLSSAASNGLNIGASTLAAVDAASEAAFAYAAAAGEGAGVIQSITQQATELVVLESAMNNINDFLKEQKEKIKEAEKALGSLDRPGLWDELKEDLKGVRSKVTEKVAEVTEKVLNDPRIQDRLSPQWKELLTKGATQDQAIEWLRKKQEELAKVREDPGGEVKKERKWVLDKLTELRRYATPTKKTPATPPKSEAPTSEAPKSDTPKEPPIQDAEIVGFGGEAATATAGGFGVGALAMGGALLIHRSRTRKAPRRVAIRRTEGTQPQASTRMSV